MKILNPFQLYHFFNPLQNKIYGFRIYPKKKSVNKEGHVAQAVVVRMNTGNMVNGIVLQQGCSSHQLSLGDACAEVLPRTLQKGDLTPPFPSIKPPYFFFFFCFPTSHAPVVFPVDPIGCWNIKRVGTCSLAKSPG